MPLPIPFDWSEDNDALYFVLQSRGVKAKSLQGGVLVSEVYVKVNIHPSIFEVDLLHEIDPDHPKTKCRVSTDKVTITLRKKVPGLWEEFRAKGTKAELKERRQAALQAAEARETARVERRGEWRQELLKTGEQEQWRLDRENREQIEKWEQEEKAKWEEAVYASFDEETGMLQDQEAAGPAPVKAGDLDEDFEPPKKAPVERLPKTTEAADFNNEADMEEENSKKPPKMKKTVSFADDFPSKEPEAKPQVVEVTDEVANQIRSGTTQEQPQPDKSAEIWSKEDLDDTEEYLPDVRQNPGKIGIRFTARPRAGVPVRDRGQRAPPFPKQQVKADNAPPMLEGDEPGDENDPVWLKDKGDTLLTSGDYQGACNAYTAALKIALNARCFANRAVAQLYMGNLEQCLEDCHHGLRILDKRAKVPDGQMGGNIDPQDQVVRARLEIRMATAYLWLGAFKKAEEHFTQALETEDGLDLGERNKVKEDLARVQAAKVALALKDKADLAADRAAAGKKASSQQEDLAAAVAMYEEACQTDPRSAVIYANRSFTQLKAEQYEACLKDGEEALACLKQWPTARKPPKPPAQPAHLDPPFLDDPTFKHPDEQKQGEVDWLMKHGGGSWKDLPSLPPEYEWVKDAAEKSGDAWIAIRKKMPKATIDAIRRATTKLQDVLYTRNSKIVREHLIVAIEENKAGEGPSNKAIRQSEEFAEKLEVHEKERALELEKELEEARVELEDYDLDAALAATKSGMAQAGFGRNHPVERTKRRLFVKVLLRRARALEALGQKEAAAEELQRALRAEPTNEEGWTSYHRLCPKQS